MDSNVLLAELKKRAEGRQLFIQYFDLWSPESKTGVYQWQADFHNAGANYPERLLIAANRVGKTRTAAAEIAIHLTGEYPKWWEGRRFSTPVNFWTGSESNEASRDVVQLALLGPEGQHGTGWIPRDRIVKVTYRQAGVSNVVDTIYARHASGGNSQVTLKTYEQERAKWQGTSLHGIWLDEEPGQPLFTEAQTRLLDKKGFLMMTFTPLKGPTEVVRHFLEAQSGSGIYVKNASWDDAPHLDPEEKERLWNSYPEHEREARTKGTPLLGSGAVFPIADSSLMVAPFEIPDHFYRINGVDFGIDHPAAGAFLAVDRDSDTIYVYDCYKMAGQTPVYHVPTMQKHGIWIPTAWPHDGFQREKGSGVALKDQYRKLGLYMLPEHAQYKDERGNAVEPAIIEMLEYMRTNRFKVFSHLNQWFEEKRMYHRKDGTIVRKADDIISATRYAFMMRRFARHKPRGAAKSNAPPVPIAGPRRWR